MGNITRKAKNMYKIVEENYITKVGGTLTKTAEEINIFTTEGDISLYSNTSIDIKAEDGIVLGEYEAPKNQKYQIDKGWWTKNKDDTVKLNKANLGDTVYFHITTKNIDCGQKLECMLFDSDALFIFRNRPDDYIFNKKEVHKTAIVKENKAVIEVHLDRNWEDNLKNDRGYDLELYWKVTYKDIYKCVASTKDLYLEVEFSNQTLFFKPSIAGGKLPQLIAKDGSPLFLTTLKDAAVKRVQSKFQDKAKSQLKTKIKEGISNTIKSYNNNIDNKVTSIALVKLSKGHLMDDKGKLHTKARNIYEYTEKVFGKEVTVKRGKNFGSVKASTRSVNQAHYFATNGKKVEVLNTIRINPIMSIDDAEETLGNLFDLVSFSMMSLEDITSKPFSSPDFILSKFLPKNAVLSIALWVEFLGYVALLEHNKQEAMVDEVMQNKLERAKNEGLEAVRGHLNKYDTDYDLIAISNKTLAQLLTGKFKTLDELLDYDSSSRGLRNIELLVKEIKKEYRKENPRVVESILFQK